MSSAEDDTTEKNHNEHTGSFGQAQFGLLFLWLCRVKYEALPLRPQQKLEFLEKYLRQNTIKYDGPIIQDKDTMGGRWQRWKTRNLEGVCLLR